MSFGLKNPATGRVYPAAMGGDSVSESPKRPQPQTPATPSTEPRIIDAEQLFHGNREVWIEHAGVRYRLRITRRNKLILQK